MSVFLSICSVCWGTGRGCLKSLNTLSARRGIVNRQYLSMGCLWTVCTLSGEVYSALQQCVLAFLHWLVDLKTGLDHPPEVHLSLLPHERPLRWQSVIDERNKDRAVT